MIELLHQFVVPAAFAVLPGNLTSPEATAMLLAIALQESKAEHRRQVRGPARGFWQFERIGIAGVQEHARTKSMLAWALVQSQYSVALTPADLHAIVEHNDVLAAVFARLALWPLKPALPTREQADEGWRQYLRAWRPGKPHPETWPANYARAWALVDTGGTDG